MTELLRRLVAWVGLSRQPRQAHQPASAECTLAARPGYDDLHADCRQTRDLPLPFALGILLQPRCGRPCHPPVRQPP